jgi:hypothetical protein
MVENLGVSILEKQVVVFQDRCDKTKSEEAPGVVGMLENGIQALDLRTTFSVDDIAIPDIEKRVVLEMGSISQFLSLAVTSRI